MKKVILLGLISLIGSHLYAQTGHKPDSNDLNNDSIPIESVAQFPGGQDSLRRYIERKKQWVTGQKTIVGKVHIQFNVNEDGKISDIQILKGMSEICEPCDKEAIRLIENLPDWIPAKLNGRPVRSRVAVAIPFNWPK